MGAVRGINGSHAQTHKNNNNNCFKVLKDGFEDSSLQGLISIRNNHVALISFNFNWQRFTYT